jgi:hypothetical protein
VPVETIGYPDWRRRFDLDGELLVRTNGVVTNQVQTFGPFYVGDFAYLAGNMAVVTNPVQVTVSWYADAALTTFVGRRDFIIDPTGVRAGYFRFLNQSRYVTVRVDPVAVVNYAITLGLFPTNRMVPTEWLPDTSGNVQWLNRVLDQSIVATGVFTQVSNFIWSGAATICIATAAQPGVFVIDAQNVPGTWTAIWEHNLAANLTTTFGVALPGTATRIRIINSGAGTSTFTMFVVHSMSGAT